MNSKLLTAVASTDVARRKPFYHRILADYRFDDDSRWRQWVEDEQGVRLEAYQGDLTLKDVNVDALPIDESRGSFGGLTPPKGVVHLDDGTVLALATKQKVILCYRKGQQGFEPLWPVDGLDQQSPYYLDNAVDLYFAAKGELVVVDSGKQQVVWFCWPSLAVKHVERFCQHKPVAICGSFSEGYTVALSPVDKTLGDAKIIRIDTSYQHCKSFVLPDVSLHRVLAMRELADHSLLLLRCPDKNDVNDIHSAKVWRLSQFLIDKVNQQWKVLSIDAVVKIDEIQCKPMLPAFQLIQGKLYQPDHCCELQPLPDTLVNRQGYIESHHAKVALVSVPRRIRLKKSRRLISPAIAGSGDLFAWDRLVFEADILAHTSIVIETKTADRLLSDKELTQSLHLPWSQAIRLDSNSSKQLLVQSKPGRYLYLSLSFYGDGFSAPSVDAINIEAPRMSALQWLPPVYHQDQESRHFLDRFLSYFDVVFDEIGYQADHFARYLDPASVPDEDFLDWLASWFDWQFIPETPTLTKREIISQLMSYYRMRGTANGIKQLLRWYTGLSAPFPQIIEHFVFRRLQQHQIDQVYLGEHSFYASTEYRPHVFTILLPEVLVQRDSVEQTDAAKLRLKRLVDVQKPAHCLFDIKYFSSHCVIGSQSTIGVDMVVGRGSCDEADFNAVTL